MYLLMGKYRNVCMYLYVCVCVCSKNVNRMCVFIYEHSYIFS